MGIANRVGSFSKDSANISTDAVRFATRGEIFNENKGHDANMGSQVNAARHTLWQATIASKWGAEIAKEAGDAHEDDAKAIDGKSEAALKVMNFKTIEEAEQAVNLSNNIIGRRIGEANKGAGMKIIAQKVADEFHKNGLWTTTKQKNGTYQIDKTKISDDQYKKITDTYSGLSNDGFTPDEQKTRDDNVRAREAGQKKINSTIGPKM